MTHIDTLTPSTEPQTFTFDHCTMYRTGEMSFGVHRTDCRKVIVTTGQKYAQYKDAIRVEYIAKGTRKARYFLMTYKPWIRIIATGDAIEPDVPMVDQGNGSSVSRYTSCDPRWETDFEDKLEASGVRLLCSIGAGDREGEHVERCKVVRS